MRKVNDRFHMEGERIIKTSNGQEIPLEEEPVLILRGRDKLAVALLYHYLMLSHLDGCNDYQMESLKEVIEKFKEFSVKFPERMKQPGVTRGL